MTAYTDSLGFNKGTAAYDANGVASVTKITVRLDFAKIIAARAAAGVAALAATDTLQVIQLPANSIVLAAGMNVVTAGSSATPTIDIGFTGGSPAAANVYGNDLATNSTGLKAANAAAATVVAAADTLDVLLNTAVATDAVIDVFAVVANCN